MAKIIIEAATRAELFTILAEFGLSTNSPTLQTSAMPSNNQAPAMPQMPTPPVDEDNEAPNANAPAFDSTGLPWDARIHSDSKGVNKDGTWRRKRGVNDQLVSAIEAELRSSPQPQHPAPMFEQPAISPQPTMPQNGGGYPLPGAAPVAQPQMDFNTFIQGVAKGMQPRPGDGVVLIDPGFIQHVSGQFGINSLNDLVSRPDLIPQVHQYIVQSQRWPQ